MAGHKYQTHPEMDRLLGLKRQAPGKGWGPGWGLEPDREGTARVATLRSPNREDKDEDS